MDQNNSMTRLVDFGLPRTTYHHDNRHLPRSESTTDVDPKVIEAIHLIEERSKRKKEEDDEEECKKKKQEDLPPATQPDDECCDLVDVPPPSTKHQKQDIENPYSTTHTLITWVKKINDLFVAAVPDQDISKSDRMILRSAHGYYLPADFKGAESLDEDERANYEAWLTVKENLDPSGKWSHAKRYPDCGETATDFNVSNIYFTGYDDNSGHTRGGGTAATC